VQFIRNTEHIVDNDKRIEMNSFTEKIERKRNALLKRVLKGKSLLLYKAYWHMRICEKKLHDIEIDNADLSSIYIASGINYGAGIGHQMSGWLGGYCIAKHYGMRFAHMPFFINGQHAELDDYYVQKYCGLIKFEKPLSTWDDLLGLGEGEKTVDALLKEGYKIIKLPFFDFNSAEDSSLFERIVLSYIGKKVIFQLFTDNVGYLEEGTSVYRDKFRQAKVRVNDKTIYDKAHYNIAIHIRRGDVNRLMPERFREEVFFVNALRSIVDALDDAKRERVQVYIYSEGGNDFYSFKKMENDPFYQNRIHYCLNGSAKETFLHLVYADELIISPSGFSAIAALVGNARCYKPHDYHYLGDSFTWINLDEKGNIISKST